MERFLDYWRAGRQQENLHNFIAKQVETTWQTLSAENLANFSNGEVVVVAPKVAKHNDQYFIPCLLLAEVQDQRLIAQPHLSLPIIPRSILEPAPLQIYTLGTDQDFDNYLAINPPAWLDEPELLTWSAQLVYAHEMIDAVKPTWQTDLQELGYELQETGYVFSANTFADQDVYDDINFEADIFTNPQKITLINAERNADTHEYARRLIIEAWIQAALKQMDPPRYVWLRPQQPVAYANIFVCMQSGITATNTTDIHPQLLAEYEIYLQGHQVLRNWQEFAKRIQDKYADKGGVQARLEQLQDSAQETKTQTRHIQVLHSIWLRQKELLTEWSKVFDFIPGLQKQRLARLHNFFKQNFPQENVNGFTQAQFDALIREKVRRAENNERMVGDALHQVENDLHQVQLVKDKCLQWCRAQNIATADMDEIKKYLDNDLWLNLAQTALAYWQQDFVAKQQYANFMTQIPTAIDLLIVEHAEYIAPLQAVELLAISKRAVVMGNYNPLCIPRFTVQIDYELTKHFALAENDADFEDLQFDGVLASMGNMWNLVVQGRDADQIFEANTNTDLQFKFINVSTSSAKYLGSLVNQGAVVAVMDWLQQQPTLTDCAIYTCFTGQALLLQQTLSTTAFAHIPVRLLQQPNFSKSALNIFVPVYSATDPGPYVFDRGTEMFDQLLANTGEQLVIIGDKRIFKPSLHSATGKFAQLFSAQLSVEAEKLKIEEANCV